MCSCLKQKIFDLEYNKSNIYNIKNQNFNNFNDLFYSNVVDEKNINQIFLLEKILN